MDKPTRRVVEAEEFRVVDSKGRLRVCISADNRDGAPTITMHDGNGSPRISLQLDDDLPRINCHAPSGQAVVCIGVHDDGEPTLCLTRNDGRLGFWVRLAVNEDTMVLTCDKDGQPLRGTRNDDRP